MKEICGCCEGIKKITPEPVENRPGLSKLSYRVGTYASFLETMMASLSTNYLEIPSDEFDDQGNLKTTIITPLQSLAVRTKADPAIALLDAWATVADVLTFYQDRIANEGYLRTATERRSILELARLVGYTLRPGVAASVYLAYIIDDGLRVNIPKGARSMSVPVEGEQPQSFETSEDLDARPEWNLLKPRVTRPKMIDPIKYRPKDLDTLYFNGISSNLNPNDRLLFLFCDQKSKSRPCSSIIVGPVMSVQAAEIQAAEGRTRVDLQGHAPEPVEVKKIDVASLLKPESLLKPPSIQPSSPLALTTKLTDVFSNESDVGLKIASKLNPLLESTLYPALANASVTDPSQLESIQAFRVKAAPFGRNAPPKPIYDDKGVYKGQQEEWPINGTEEVAVIMIPFKILDPLPEGPAILSESHAEATFTPLVVLSVKRGSTVLSKTVQLPQMQLEKQVQLDGITVSLSVEKDVDGTSTTIFSFHLGNESKRTKDISLITGVHTDPDSNKTTQVTIIRVDNKDIVRDLTPGGNWQISTDTDRVKVDFTLSDNRLSISDESLLPPNPKNVIYLDSVYDKILPDSWVVIERPISSGCMNDLPDPKEPLANGIVRLVRQVKGVNDAASPNYGTSSTVTQLTLDNPWLCDSDLLITVLRGTTVYAQSEPLDLAEDPIEDPVCKNGLELDRLYDGLQAGRWLIISGERTDIPGTSGVIASEVAMLAGVRQGLFQVDAATDSSSSTTTKMDLPRDKYHTFLDLASDLSYCYKRDTVSIYGNVAKATHGETFNEILGSGDASKSGQSFTLHQLPLTFTSAPTPSGIESTLKVSLDDIFWHEFDSFAGLGPTDHGYVTLRDDDDVTTVIFGDGQHGARPHTGVENIRAVYRAGIGKLGNVGAGQISQIITRLAGMRSVINSMPATGGADREDRDQARHNVPLALMALDRLISIKDYADFARTFGGIGKASSAKQSDGRRQVVHVTIAGEDDIPIDSNSDLYQNLLKALRKFGDPDQAVQVDVRCLIMLIIGAKIKVLPDYQWSSIEPKVRAALLDTFSFENRDLGQDAQLSEAISAIQSVPGVAYVDVDVFGGIPEKDSSGNPLPPADIAARISTLVDNGPSSRVVASIANLDEGVIHPAQIAYFVPSIEETLQLTELK